MNQSADIQLLTPDEFVNQLDPNGELSDVERDVHKELYKLAEIATNSQELFADVGSLVGMIINKMNQVEENNADILERAQVIHGMLTAPEDKH